ncbi:solute carrier family 41 member 2 [Austrofundulus limnaeus]|uniref:Solute carrier family 41 member n=1 Tax=Austrofundulus limnaeus TaxID=52670 RepID=A0A2I4B018_AUSLI|nr:PREDICTED: solute carrier family 41 member 2-like [Austrofundulus limnaeus]XP_013861074.1 PREDICTED: solute carrier family 41 member 2-like [Austrofundulus limnaeus]
MVVPKSPEKKLPQNLCLEARLSPNPSLSQNSGGLKHSSSNGSFSSVTSLELRPQEFSETDALLPNELYGGSRFSRSLSSKDPEGSSGPEETVCSMVLQILVPFLLAGFGTVSAGMLLDVVQSWDVFQDISEIFILVPAVLGMKGNLETTLASRLSTAVNAGKMESSREKWLLIVGNLALKQLQATVLGLLASVMATLLGWMAEGQMSLNHLVLLCSTSLSTAFVASLLQGVIMVGVIIGCKKIGLNPDNVATPLAASFGDLITLALLACFSQWFYSFMEFYPYVLYLVDLFYLCLIPVWMVVSSKHPASLILLRTGWEPIIAAMLISSVGGLILDKTVSDPNLAGIIVYAPVINGVGGNLISIQCSRISTDLHLNYSTRGIPEGHKVCLNPFYTFFGSGANHRSAQVLLLLVLPGQLIFIHVIHLMKGGLTLPSPLFTVFFLSASLIQVFLLLCTADCMVHCLWRRGKDPDSYSIPYLTALGDLLGTALLALVFVTLWCIGDTGNV